MTELYIDTVERRRTRAGDGTLWRTYLKLNAAGHTVWINPFLGRT